MAKSIPYQGKHREFGNFAKTKGIWFAQVSFVYVIVTNHVNWHREKLLSDRENTGNLKMQFEWVPCTSPLSLYYHTLCYVK